MATNLAKKIGAMPQTVSADAVAQYRLEYVTQNQEGQFISLMDAGVAAVLGSIRQIGEVVVIPSTPDPGFALCDSLISGSDPVSRWYEYKLLPSPRIGWIKTGDPASRIERLAYAIGQLQKKVDALRKHQDAPRATFVSSAAEVEMFAAFADEELEIAAKGIQRPAEQAAEINPVIDQLETAAYHKARADRQKAADEERLDSLLYDRK